MLILMNLKKEKQIKADAEAIKADTSDFEAIPDF